MHGAVMVRAVCRYRACVCASGAAHAASLVERLGWKPQKSGGSLERVVVRGRWCVWFVVHLFVWSECGDALSPSCLGLSKKTTTARTLVACVQAEHEDCVLRAWSNTSQRILGARAQRRRPA